MPSLKDFVAALQAGWFPALAALVGCGIILIGDYFKIRYLDTTPSGIITTAVVIATFSLSVLIANVAYLPAILWQRYRRQRHNKIRKERILREIESAPPQEKELLCYMVTSGRKAFVAEFGDRRLAPLVAKGLITRLGGTHNLLEWPYIVQEDTWEYLLDNQDRFYVKIYPNSEDPFHWRNGRW
ncbi:hypothetical protein [Ancylobacter sp. G4_0304]|uniref:hypothetical protein n=1 Tax=Ancylobacter sp. G4_0304 TaxID=3114289 RepID=UPI0039C5F0D8